MSFWTQSSERQSRIVTYSYIYGVSGNGIHIVLVCHFGRNPLREAVLEWVRWITHMFVGVFTRVHSKDTFQYTHHQSDNTVNR